MSANQEFNLRDDDGEIGRWSHLSKYERRCVQAIIEAYDQIMQAIDDVPRIAVRYQLSYDDVQRAKDYAFGSGVSEYQFIADIDMAEAWQRLASGQENDLDEVFLRHEILESDLVINQGMDQLEAHKLTQTRYPWSILIKMRRRNE